MSIIPCSQVVAACLQNIIFCNFLKNPCGLKSVRAFETSDAFTGVELIILRSDSTTLNLIPNPLLNYIRFRRGSKRKASPI